MPITNKPLLALVLLAFGVMFISMLLSGRKDQKKQQRRNPAQWCGTAFHSKEFPAPGIADPRFTVDTDTNFHAGSGSSSREASSMARRKPRPIPKPILPVVFDRDNPAISAHSVIGRAPGLVRARIRVRGAAGP